MSGTGAAGERLSPDQLQALADQLQDALGGESPREGRSHGSGESGRVELHLEDGRVLVVKRPPHPDAVASARVASRLLTDAGIPAPVYHPSDSLPDATLVYWRIAHPTLADRWPGLDAAGRLRALRSWGELVARLHEIRLPSPGPLPTGGSPTLVDAIAGEVERHRALLPGSWTAGHTLADRLREAETGVAERLEHRCTCLLHNDLHRSNLLVHEEDGTLCTGFLDLESCSAGPPEADLARPVVLYGTLFDSPIGGVEELLHEGYGRELDPVGLAFYRALHLLRQGGWSALRGYRLHAEWIARAAEENLREVEEALR